MLQQIMEYLETRLAEYWIVLYVVRTSLPTPGRGQSLLLASVAGGWTEQGFVSGLQTAKPMRSFRLVFSILFRS